MVNKGDSEREPSSLGSDEGKCFENPFEDAREEGKKEERNVDLTARGGGTDLPKPCKKKRINKTKSVKQIQKRGIVQERQTDRPRKNKEKKLRVFNPRFPRKEKEEIQRGETWCSDAEINHLQH